MRFILLIFFLLFFYTGHAQFKDTVGRNKPLDTLMKKKPKKEVKEDNFALRKREHVFFVSNRLCDDNKFDIFKVTPTDKEPPVIIVRGKFRVEGNPNIKKARIMIYNASNEHLVGTFNTNEYTGNYLLVLAPSVKYIFKVDMNNYPTLSEDVEVPLKIDYEVCYQELNVKVNAKNKASISVHSYFTDENEKVFYMKAMVDTNRHFSNMYQFSTLNNKEKLPAEEIHSTVDELVKKQIDIERKKPEDAFRFFKLGKYNEALQIYSLLLRNDPADPFVNYYYGICNYKLGTSKTKAVSCLQLAADCKDVPYNVFLYLGLASHQSYLFTTAIQAFENYKKKASPIEMKTNNINLLIKNCQSGATLIDEKVSIEVLKRSDIKEKEYLSAYNPENVSSVQYKTDFFKSQIDKKKLAKQLITNFHKREYIHVSYGPLEKNGLDLFVNTPLPNGNLSGAKTLGPIINTVEDENYPYLSRNGLTLYFSSKGHNSMGGYDIFKCTRPDTLSEWSSPINLGYPINSTYDDIMYVPDSTEQFAGMCTNRKNGEFEYMHLKLPNKENTYSVVKGQFVTNDSLGFRDAFISVFDINTGELAGIYKTNHETGFYLMILVSGRKYELMLEYEGLPEFRTEFNIPDKKAEFELKQIIRLVRKDNKDDFKVKNYFTEFEAERAVFEKSVGVPVVNTEKVEKKAGTKRTPEQMKLDQEDLSKAKTFFDQANFKEAALLFEKVESRVDLDPLSNYYYGVSLYNSHQDKTYCIPILSGLQREKNIPEDYMLFLARANYYSYRFKTAIGCYQHYLNNNSIAEELKNVLLQEIEYCRNSIVLVNNPQVLEVFERKHVDVHDFHRSLLHIESGSRVLVLTDDLSSSIDKKKKFKSMFYISPDKNVLLYCSYGEDETNSKDIYMRKKII
ncbi:MAG: PD40 domain-containing protein [Sphingobacteriaceae bacterium]|nr:PD40 domain-containing protein [Sphingobacteriaceae bacterium]